MREMKDILAASRVIPVVTIDELSTAVPLARAIYDGGIRVIEVVLRTPAALAAITAIKTEVPELILGAGTIQTVSDLTNSFAAGADVAISPGMTPALLAMARQKSWSYLPAAATASEIMLGLEHGYRYFKYFPATSLGTELLRHLQGPFADVKFCATGGVTRDNAKDFLAMPNVLAVGASWVTPAAAVAKRDWQAVRANAEFAATL
jgi:2-dehydro-3-deoxyphosphogluconate aldolase / (4S)-4-hydroxy-2-oxoglutarate aldolase